MAAWAKTCGPYPGGLILTHTQIMALHGLCPSPVLPVVVGDLRPAPLGRHLQVDVEGRHRRRLGATSMAGVCRFRWSPGLNERQREHLHCRAGGFTYSTSQRHESHKGATAKDSSCPPFCNLQSLPAVADMPNVPCQRDGPDSLECKQPRLSARQLQASLRKAACWFFLLGTSRETSSSCVLAGE